MFSIEELRAIRSKRRLTQEEKQAYVKYWQPGKQSQRSFCEQEGLPLATFYSWLKFLSSNTIKEETAGGFIAVELSSQSAHQVVNLALQFKLPNGLVIEGCFSLNDVGCFIKEVSNGLTPLR